MEEKWADKIEAFSIDDALGHVVNRVALIIRKKLIMELKKKRL